MMSFADHLIIQHTEAENAQERKCAAFRYANASRVLEGFATDRTQLARQEKIIQGRLEMEAGRGEKIRFHGRSGHVLTGRTSPLIIGYTLRTLHAVSEKCDS